MKDIDTESGRQPGTLVFSLDTELAWGYFDLDARRERLFSPDGSRERRSIAGLLDLCEEFEVRATWALVGHLFHPRCEDCDPCPLVAWRGRYRSFEQIHQTDHPLWYAEDVLEQLLARRDRHEIACHGYSHRPWPELSPDEARMEAETWIRLAAQRGLKPGSLVFPRNQIAHLDQLREAGFTSYRDADPLPGDGRRTPFRAALKLLGQVTGRVVPPTCALEDLDHREGLLRQPPSAYLFDIRRSLEGLLDRAGLARLRLGSLIRGIRQAGAKGEILHLWAHPWEFRNRHDLDKLRALFEVFAEERAEGRLVSATMGEITRRHAALIQASVIPKPVMQETVTQETVMQEAMS